MSLENTFTFISILISIGLIQASIENLLLFNRFPAIINYPFNRGVLKSKLAKRFSLIYNSPGTWVLSIIKLIASVWLLISAAFLELNSVPIALLLIADLLGFVRWRFLPSTDVPLKRFILIGILVHSLFDSKQMSESILLLISMLLCLIYFAAGLKKTRDQNWINGKATTFFLTKGSDSIHKWKWLGYMVILFQMTFCIGLVWPELAILFITIGVLFHLYLYLRFEFSFFFWTFISTYPAFYFSAEKIGGFIFN